MWGLITLIVTANAVTTAIFYRYYYHHFSARDTAGWLIFVAIVVMLYEAAVITVRFVNFNLINAFHKVACVVVSKILRLTESVIMDVCRMHALVALQHSSC